MPPTCTRTQTGSSISLVDKWLLFEEISFQYLLTGCLPDRAALRTIPAIADIHAAWGNMYDTMYRIARNVDEDQENGIEPQGTEAPSLLPPSQQALPYSISNQSNGGC